MKKIAIGSIAALSLYSAMVYADQVINDDLIVTQSVCVGQDCVNGESFGFDTIRLKENNLRIKFQDTSNSASFPTNDWQITANDSSNGGANKFSIDDIDGGRTPFTIEAGSPSNSLYVEDGGRIGFGTSTPVVNLHTVEGNSPTLRLEQDGSSGFTPQTWDVAGNEANFFIRDVTNGSKLPFKIKPGAPTGSIFVAADGDIGLGTESPSEELHVRSSNDPRILLDENGDSSSSWYLGINDAFLNGFGIYNQANNIQALAFRPTGDFILHTGGALVNGSYSLVINNNSKATFNGDVDVVGNFTNTSSRESKNNITKLAYSTILSKLVSLDILSWSYKKDEGKITHIGPMAEDFYSTFNVGVSEKTISPLDVAGVSLAAVKELHTVIEKQQAEIEELKLLVKDLAAKNR
ncbi:MAG: tail fiber domain-containing protein [Kangiellaceae bacterium]|nr:tail fiber domain-containing protein [Kangiellaceae bacterium]MCW9017226.1 tail fiber domain-containing protein [Kangiellaceae bacterium]